MAFIEFLFFTLLDILSDNNLCLSSANYIYKLEIKVSL